MNNLFRTTLSLIIIYTLALNTICGQGNAIPSGINYQAVAREKNGKPLANKEITVEIVLYDDNSGNITYSETHTVTTNKFGLFTLIIGQGKPATDRDSFEKVNWVGGPLRLIASIDFGNGLQQVGSVILQSVPYALVADTALKAPRQNLKVKDLIDVNVDNIQNNEVLSWNGNNWIPASIISTKQIFADEIYTKTNLNVTGKAFISDTLIVTGVFSSSGTFNDLVITGDATMKNLSVGQNIIATGNIQAGDTLKADYFQVQNIEGYLRGRVSDISDHKATELEDITDAGSGRIITDKERELLISIPAKTSGDSIYIEEKLGKETYERKNNDTNIINYLNAEIINRRISFDSLSFRISNDSLNKLYWINNEAFTRDSADNSLKRLIYSGDTLTLAIKTSLDNEILLRQVEDSIILNSTSTNIADLKQAIKQEATDRNDADILLQTNLDNEASEIYNKIDSLGKSIQDEISDRKNSEKDLRDKITSDSSTIRGLISQENAVMKDSIAVLKQLLNTESFIRAEKIESLNDSIKAESLIRYSKDSLADKKRTNDSLLFSNSLENEIFSRKSADSALSDSLSVEKKSRIKAANDLANNIATESQNRKEAVETLLAKIESDSLALMSTISEEAAFRVSSDDILSNRIDKEAYSRDTATKNNKQIISVEITDRKNADELLSNRINADSMAVRLLIDDIATPSLAQINALQLSLNNEITNRISSDDYIIDSIGSEKNQRIGSDNEILQKMRQDSLYLFNAIQNEKNARINEDNNLKNDINTETAIRSSNFSALTDSINKENLQRLNGDIKLSYRIIADSLENAINDTLLKNRLNKEISERTNADNQLLHRITADRSLKLTGNTLNLNEASDTLSVDLSAINTDNQVISYDASTHILSLANGGSVDLTNLLNDADADNSNELNSNVQLNGTTLQITDAGGTKSVNLASINTDDQMLTYNSITHILTLQNGGNVDLTPFLNSNAVLNGSNLELTDGSGTKVVDLSSINTDNQQLELNSNILSILGGNNVTFPYASESQSGLLTLADWNKFNNKPGPNLNNNHVWIGNASNIAMPVTITGDATLSNTGQLQITNNSVTSSKIADYAITSEKINSMGAISGQVLRYNGTKWIPSVDNSEYSAGNGIEINSNIISNTAQDKIVTITSGNGIEASGVYPDFLITNTQPNITHTGDVSGSSILTIGTNAVTTSKIADNSITGAKINSMGASTNQILKYNGNTWFPGTDDNTTYSAGSGLTLSGTTFSNSSPDRTVILTPGIGMTVSGIYPDFTITNSMPNANHTGDVTGNSILTISNDAITSDKILNGSVTALKLNQMGAVSGQVLKYTGTAWGPAPDNNTLYNGGTGISISGTTITNTLPDREIKLNEGSGITISGTYPDFTIINSSPNVTHTGDVIGSEELTIANDAITSSKISDGAVTIGKLDRMGAQEGEVLKWKNASMRWVPEVPSSTVYAAGNGISIDGIIITNTKPNETHNGEVIGTKTLTIINNAITTAKILDGAVTLNKIAVKSVDSTKILDGAIINSRLRDFAVTESKISTGAVSSDKISSNAVITAKINDAAVTTPKLADYAVTNLKIDANSVTENKISDGAVTANKISTDAVRTDKIYSGAVTTDKIDNEAIITSKLADGAVTSSKLNISGAINGKFLRYINNEWVAFDDNKYTAGTGISISGYTITNASPNATHTGDVLGTDGSTNLTIKDGVVTAAKLSKMGAISNQVLLFNGTKWDTATFNLHKHTSSQISDATDQNNRNTIVKRDGSGNFNAGTITASLSGNAATATKLKNPIKISLTNAPAGGVTGYTTNFDGSGDFNIVTTITSHSHTINDISDRSSFVLKDVNSNFSGNIITAATFNGTTFNGTTFNGTTFNGNINGDVNGNASSANHLKYPRTISIRSASTGSFLGRTAFDGSDSIAIIASLEGSHKHKTSEISDASTSLVLRNGSGDFSGRIITATNYFNGNLNGNANSASQANKWTTPRTLTLKGSYLSGSVSFNGEDNIDLDATIINNSHTHISSNITDATPANTNNMIVRRDGSGNFSAGGVTTNSITNNGALSTGTLTVGTSASGCGDNVNLYGETKINLGCAAQGYPYPLSYVGISRNEADNGTPDISPGIANTGSLGYKNRWKGLYSKSATIEGNLFQGTYDGNLTVKGTFSLTVGNDATPRPVMLSFYHGANNMGSEMQIIPSIGTKVFLGSATYPIYRIYVDDGAVHTSDKRIKENIIPLSASLDKVMKLKGVKYDLKREFCPGKSPAERKNKLGFIAQEVLEIVPEAVVYDSTSNLYGIKYDNLIPVLTEAIKEQQRIIDKQENRISDLEKKLEEIERRLK